METNCQLLLSLRSQAVQYGRLNLQKMITGCGCKRVGRIAKHYSLELGSFVVFRYEGNDIFHVLIFDRSASEIEYACTRTEDDNGDVSGGSKRKKKPDLPCPLPQKKMRVDSPYKSHVSVDGPDSGKIKLGNLKGNENSCLLKGQVDTHKSIGRGVRTRSMVSDTDMIVDNLNVPPVPVCLGCPKPDLISKMKPMTATEKETAEHTKTICQEIFQAKWGNHPESFRWEDLDYELQINVKEAKFLRNNWKEFVLENDLKVGDIGVFELIKENENLLEVTILSVDENG
ncbi:hypothetical protein F3Y22_tig00110437pilonHSYRG00054 [Hibiscus syriacus]|uniref:TF-B3 domain-containing protein n=1 Tax=Hibiscus syriacus TaxID=106335 RepID=A0A6A3ANJ7_HIBSY|nr:hypothetical protein F3Y22_tig00110437pilonHSYRG00054 [Hibiscus syriacus]